MYVSYRKPTADYDLSELSLLISNYVYFPFAALSSWEWENIPWNGEAVAQFQWQIRKVSSADNNYYYNNNIKPWFIIKVIITIITTNQGFFSQGKWK